MSKTSREKELQIVTKIMNLTEKENLSEDEASELASLQSALDVMYEEKARGAFIRSRRKWLEQGEKCSKYFFNLEKRNAEISSVSKLKINGTTCEDDSIISNYVANFYQKLYSRQTLDEDQMDTYCQNISQNIKKIDNKCKDLCDQKISNYEILKAIDSLKDNKSPGNDSITGELYKSFKDALTPFLVSIFEESITKGKLPPSMQQGQMNTQTK